MMCLARGRLSSKSPRDKRELLIHSPCLHISQSGVSNLQILSSLFPTSLFRIYFRVCTDSQSEHYEGLPSPDVIQSKKQELISYLSKMLHFPSSLRVHSQHYQSFDYPQ